MFSTLSQSNWKICQAPKLMMPMFSLPIIVTPAVIMTQLGKLLTFYPDADPDPLPEVANDPDPEPMDIVEDDLDDNGDANRDIGEPNEVPSAAIQQLVRLLPPLRPPPPLRSANPP
ncbi:hypothetical protein MHU86_4455 [Fragilaria crotonensis]|nr:hypothetical protein MHU86_4455 [Fragilaria crotonensis]